MFSPETLGFVAGFLTTISFLPQAIKAWKTKSTKDISLPMYLVFILGVFLWIIYGFMINSLVVMLANVVTLLIALFILYLKIRYG
ncbi:MAG: SemiSWEET transporter [Candidatus Diapherotrites archaeon]|nr:SemiSWEET transporter [Candidatus Diapherotrites archaeon]